MVRIRDLTTTEYLSVDGNEPLTQLFGRLVNKQHTEAFVFSQASPNTQEFVGMFAYPYLPYRVDSKDVTVRTVTRPVPQLSPDDSLLRAGQLFYESGHAALPVIANGKFTGVVGIFDVLPKILGETGKMKVKDVRNEHAKTVGYATGIGDVIGLMRDTRTDRVPVVDERGLYVGIITYLDLVESYYLRTYERDEGMRPGSLNTRAYRAEPLDLLRLPAQNFMNPADAVSVQDSDTLETAVKVLADGNVLGAVVMDGEKPIGVITMHDLLHPVMGAQIEQLPVIHYKGLRELSIGDYTTDWIKKISSYYVEKLQASVDNEVEVIVHIKERSAEGGTHRYTANVRLTFPGATLAAEAQEWDLRRAVHDAFRGIEVELSNFLRREDRPLSAGKLAAREGDPNLPGGLAAE